MSEGSTVKRLRHYLKKMEPGPARRAIRDRIRDHERDSDEDGDDE